jgi:hypothetical protein
VKTVNYNKNCVQKAFKNRKIKKAAQRKTIKPERYLVADKFSSAKAAGNKKFITLPPFRCN